MARRRPCGGLDVAHQGGLGDLDDQRRGVQAAQAEGFSDVVDDGVVVELAPGDVDGHVEGVASGVPCRGLRAGLSQHPAADFADLAGLFEDGDELVGLDDASGGVVPAQEGFDADQAEVVEVVDGLVDEPELVAVERGAQLELEFDAVLDFGLHLGVEDFVAVLAGRFGLVERDIGVA